MNIKILKAVGKSAVLLLASAALYGCMMNTVETHAECSWTPDGRQCSAGVTVQGNFLTGGTINPADIQLMQLRLIPENITLLNSSGSFVLKVYNASGLVGAKTFSYQRNGEYIQSSDPYAVSYWLSNFSGITAIKPEIRDMKYDYAVSYMPGSGEKASLKVEAYYNGESVASGTTYVSDICSSPMAWKFPQCAANPQVP